MNAEIISVGAELMIGDIANTDAQFLAYELTRLGMAVNYQTTLDDDTRRIKKALMTAVSRSNVIVFIGGIGLAPDDLTKEAVCEAIDLPLEEHTFSLQRMEEHFRRVGREMPAINRKQIMMPRGATVFPNDVGTAPGCAIESGNQCIILLPDHPRELIPMFRSYVIDFLNRYIDGVVVTRTVNVFGISESQVADRLGDMLVVTPPIVTTYAKDGEVQVKITARGNSKIECDNLCSVTVQRIHELLGDVVYGEDRSGLEEVVVDALKQKQLRLAAAESCTAGMLTSRLTSIPGASEVFDFGVSTYSDEAKERLLGVDRSLLIRYGAVSEQVAGSMAINARRMGSADLGVGITGIAGPGGGTSEKPIGLVYIAVSDGRHVWTRRIMVGHGDPEREHVRRMASSYALDMVRGYLAALPFLMEGSRSVSSGFFGAIPGGMGPAPAGSQTQAAQPSVDTIRLDQKPAPAVIAGEWDYDAGSILANDKGYIYPAEDNGNGDTAAQRLPWHKRLRRHLFPVKGDSVGEGIRKVFLLLFILTFLISAGVLIKLTLIDPYLVGQLSSRVGDQFTNPGERNSNMPPDMVDRFSGLWTTNNDIKGMMILPDASGEKTYYPVVQTNNDTMYLDHDFNKQKSRHGTFFLQADAILTSSASSQNLVVYGHNMKDGSMMGTTQKKYRSLDYYKANPTIAFSTVYDKTDVSWKVFAVFITNSRAEHNNGYVFDYILSDFSTQDQFLNWIGDCRERSLINTPVDIRAGDTILTLSTCSYEFSDARLVIMARRVRNGESTTVDVGRATKNSDPLYPQAWRDKYGKGRTSTVSRTPAISSSQSVRPSVSSTPTTSSTSSQPSTSSTPSQSSGRPPSSSSSTPLRPPVSSNPASSQPPSSSSDVESITEPVSSEMESTPSETSSSNTSADTPVDSQEDTP